MNLQSKSNKYLLSCLLLSLLGIFIRFFYWNSVGLQDAEWWRAWMFGIHKYGILNLYQVDKCSSSLYEALVNKSIVEPPFYKRGCQTIIQFEPNNYFRNYFPIVQPPLFYFELLITNFFGLFLDLNDYKSISLVNSIWTAFSTFIFYLIGRRIKLESSLLISILIIWLNPILIWSANVQLYKDIPLLLLIFLSLYFWLKNQDFFSLIFWGMAIIFKPTAILLLPFYISAFNYKIVYSALPFVLTIFFYFYNHSIIGYLVSLYSITDTMGLSGAEGVGFFKFVDVFLFLLSKIYSHNYHFIEYCGKLISILTMLFIFYFSVHLKLSKKINDKNFDKILCLLFMLVFFRYGIQVNHWIVILPFALIGILRCQSSARFILMLLVLYFVQDYIYGGVLGNLRFANKIFKQFIFVLLTISICFVLAAWIRKIKLFKIKKSL